MGFPSAVDIISNPGELKSLFGLNPCVVGDVAIDLAMSYSDPIESYVTERPVEKGFAITDAKYTKPQYLTLEVILTDPDFSGENIAKQAIGGTLKQSLTTSWREKRDRLRELTKSKELITISTYEDTYDNMIILEMIPDRRASTANAYFCTLNCREIRQVASSTGFVDVSSIPKQAREKESTDQKTTREKRKPGKAEAGTKQTSTATEQESSVLEGLLFGGD